MTREELEHVIRAAAEVTNEYEFVVVGSQSILGPIPNPPAELTMSMEADIYPMNAEERPTTSTEPWAKALTSMRPMATTHKASTPLPPACRTVGRSDCDGSKASRRMGVLAIAWR
jgi:hypothetical protein